MASNINQTLKGLGPAGVAQSLLRRGRAAANGLAGIAAAVNTTAKPTFITLTVENNNANDKKYFSLLAQPHINYTGYTTPKTGGGTWPVQTDNGAEETGSFIFTPQVTSGTMTGWRWLINHQKPYFVGFSMKVNTDVLAAAQYNNSIQMLEGGYDASPATPFTTDNIAGASSSSFEQQVRIIARAFVLYEGNDLLFLLNPATALTIVFNLVSFDNHKLAV